MQHLTRHQCVDCRPHWQCYSTPITQLKTISGLFTLLGLFRPQVCESNACVQQNLLCRFPQHLWLYYQNRVVSFDRLFCTASDKFLIGTFVALCSHRFCLFSFFTLTENSNYHWFEDLWPLIEKCHFNFLIYRTSPETAEVIETWFLPSQGRQVTAEQLQF